MNASRSLPFYASNKVKEPSDGKARSHPGFAWSLTLMNFDWRSRSQDVCVFDPSNGLQTSTLISFVCLTTCTSHISPWLAVIICMNLRVCDCSLRWRRLMQGRCAIRAVLEARGAKEGDHMHTNKQTETEEHWETPGEKGNTRKHKVNLWWYGCDHYKVSYNADQGTCLF